MKMKMNHIILIVMIGIVSSSCSIKTIEVIVEDEQGLNLIYVIIRILLWVRI